MQRDPRAFLWDVRESALAIQAFTAGMDAAAFAANEMAQSAVERKFEIIGEALNQLAKLDAALAARIHVATCWLAAAFISTVMPIKTAACWLVIHL